MFIGYDRQAWAGRDDPELRMTFDSGLRWRNRQLDLSEDHGFLLLPRDMRLLEIKIAGAAPLWLSRLLSSAQAYPTSFSKYGAYYKDVILGGRVGEYYMKEEQKSA